MRTLLVPTDFSKNSNNAVDYAARMAVDTKAKLVLLHVYHVPTVVQEVPVIIPDIDSLEKDSDRKLNEVRQRVQLSFGSKLTVETVSKCGFASEEICAYANQIKPDLVVMGVAGTNYVEERLFGSVATSVVEDCKFPALLVGEKITYSKPEKVVLACDYNEYENSKVIAPLIKLAKTFKSKIYVLNVEKELEPSGSAGEIVSEFIKLELAMSEVDHSFHFIGNNSVSEGINEFAAMTDANIVVTMPKKHSILHRFFEEPNTKKLAFHSKIPLLTLPNTK